MPSLQDLQTYRVTRPGQKEGVRWSFYDSLLYIGAGVNRLDFFQQPQGQGITTALGAVVGAAKSIHDTNMDLQGQLPRFQDFKLESIELKFYPGASLAANTFTAAPIAGVHAAPIVAADLASVNDVNTWRQSGALILTVSSKDYLKEAPLDRFPGKTHLEQASSQDAGAANTSFTKTADVLGRPYFLDPPIMLLSNQNFVVTLLWPGLVALPSTFNARIVCVMEGILYRNSQ